MSKKLRVVLSGIYYPLAMLRYFEAAFKRRDDVELITLGPYTGTWIPWAGGMDVMMKYANPPTCALPKDFIRHGVMNIDVLNAFSNLNDIDLWIQADAGWRFDKRPNATVVAHLQTDPHVLGDQYRLPRTYSDIVFNMQKSYSEPDDKYIPYAIDPIWHSPMDGVEKEHASCLIGLHYDNRNKLVQRLRSKGLDVYYDIGPIYDEYREIYARSKTAINWSSKDDLIARVFETMGFNVPLITNRVTDLPTHFVEGEHYLGFDDMNEAEEKVVWALENYDKAMEIADNAHRKVFAQHTYDMRVSDMLRWAGF